MIWYELELEMEMVQCKQRELQDKLKKEKSWCMDGGMMAVCVLNWQEINCCRQDRAQSETGTELLFLYI